MLRVLTTTALCLGLGLGLAQAQSQQDVMPQGSQTPGPETGQPVPPPAGGAAPAAPNSTNPPSANPSTARSGRVVDTTPGADVGQPAPARPPAGQPSDPKPPQPQAADPERFMPQQGAEQISAEDVIGATVYDADENDIGTVSDLVLDASGMIQGAVIGVGGFLGLGEKDVAIRFGELRHQFESDGDIRIMLQVTREQLEDAPEYVYLRDQRNTEGATGAVRR